MIKNLKLTKAIVAIALGVAALIVAKIMEAYKVTGSQLVLAISGVLLIMGALIFLYPILFAKKADKDGRDVELTPAARQPVQPVETESVAS
jgi:predicted membrane channel-forming protein YqfA (hemolysin III family)